MATVIVNIVTHILAGDPQAGMKSTQTVVVDFDKKKVTQTFSTGVTNVGFDIGSVRDNFVVENEDFSAVGRVGFTVRGQTASGVMFMPNINYEFHVALTPAGKGALEGCHDGYPAYSIDVDGKKVYDFAHKKIDLIKLFGACDVLVPTKEF